jgi:hypothetical protein
MPFLTSVTKYQQVQTVTFEGLDLSSAANGSGVSSTTKPGLQVRFADTYAGVVPCTFRFKLSSDPEQIIQMHKDFRTAENLKQTLLVRNAQNVTVITATQYTGEEFFQGGLNVFKNQLADQLKNGVYMTERKQVEVEATELAPVTMHQTENSPTLQSHSQLVWKTVPVTDATTGLPRRTEDPLSIYGIEATQVTIGDPQPENQLQTLLMDKKRLVADRIRAVQEQETFKAQSNTEQLKKEIQRTRAVQDAQREKELSLINAQREKELAVIQQQREVQVARSVAERMMVEKEKELQMAQASLAINKAASEAAIHEAKAIKAKGMAEADVLAATYAAKGKHKDIYLSEMQRDTNKVLYENLPNFQITMPNNYINSGGSGSGANGSGMTSNLDVITGLGALGMLDASKKAASGRLS